MQNFEKMMNQVYLFIFIMSLIAIILSAIVIISLWKIFKKSGRKGWESLIPIYNIIVLLQICDLSIIYLLLLLIPFVNIYALVKIGLALSTKFNKSSGVGILCGLVMPIGLPIIAFSKEKNIKKDLPLEEEKKEQAFEPSIWTTIPMEADNNLKKTIETPLNYIEPIIEVKVEPIKEKNITINEINTLSETKIETNQPSLFKDKICPNCGAKLGNNAKGCFMCGKTF